MAAKGGDMQASVSVSTFVIFIVFCVCGVQSQIGQNYGAPMYLSVENFRSCLLEEPMGTYSVWCMPRRKRADCPQHSHDELAELQDIPVCQDGGANGWADPRLRSLPRPPPEENQQGGENGWADPRLRGLPRPSPEENLQGGENGWADPRLRGLPRPPPEENQQGGENGWADPRLRGLPRPPPEGSCPANSAGSMGICVHECDSNEQCPDGKLCCSNGCGKVCLEAKPERVGGEFGWPGNPNLRALPRGDESNTDALDLVFVLDMSSSVGTVSNWNLILSFVSRVISNLPVSQQNIRVGLVTFTENAVNQFLLKSHSSKQNLITNLMNIQYLGGSSNTAQGLQIAYNTQFTALNGDRSGVKNVVILISGGDSNINPQYTIPISQALQSGGTSIISIGIGSAIDVDDLKAVSSLPREENLNWWRVTDYQALEGISHDIVSATYHAGGMQVEPTQAPRMTTTGDRWREEQGGDQGSSGNELNPDRDADTSTQTDSENTYLHNTKQSTAVMGPWVATLCELGSLVMECPAGYRVSVDSGFWGRKPGVDLCDDGKQIYTDRCNDPTAIDKIADRCNDKEKCEFVIHGDVLGNPCEGFYHYLNITFTCHLPYFNEIVCEGDYLSMRCQEGQEIRVVSANYGRTRGDEETCPQVGLNNDACENTDTLSSLSILSDGRPWDQPVFVHVASGSEKFFTNTCPRTAKYLNVTYTCAECVNSWGNDEDCDNWAYDGDCVNNRDWMYGHCRKSCSHCQKYEDCENTYVSDANRYSDCNMRAIIGECHSNMNWMKDNCQSSCDFCNLWASLGECTRNSDFMNKYCARSCNACKKDMQYELPTVETTTWRPQETPEPTTDTNADVKTVTACYGTNAHLSCPAGAHVRVFDAFFGRREGSEDICKPKWDDEWHNQFTVCDTDSSQPFLTAVKQCNGRSDCYLWSGDDTFTDECPEQESQRYYLQVEYVCEPCRNVHEDDCDCAFWVNNDQCTKNRFWMNNNCFKHCSGCTKVDVYENTSEDNYCDYWATRGSCEVDHVKPWMLQNCAKSCRVAEKEEPVALCNGIV